MSQRVRNDGRETIAAQVDSEIAERVRAIALRRSTPAKIVRPSDVVREAIKLFIELDNRESDGRNTDADDEQAA